ncbi:cupin domain-containing protein [Rhizorhabdus sp.]|uniref:cupin domain-containing protein n=1 Tax=Rhizorhabdus sp. TaxID=1968843 RepID=UPI00199ACE42|nr:cupin domain-containing protein [Rhizorhabdus sp.]MBD3761915.1 cupin domain-containing protein [Rhizorhabdus sp.]
MKGFVDNIERLTLANSDFRRVLYTGHNLQLVLMAIPPGGEIGEEVHEDRDQFFRIESGEGQVWIDGVCHFVKGDDGIVVPQGARHNVICQGREPLRLYTIYGPPEHVDGTIHATRADAEAAHEHFDGRVLTGHTSNHQLDEYMRLIFCEIIGGPQISPHKENGPKKRSA